MGNVAVKELVVSVSDGLFAYVDTRLLLACAQLARCMLEYNYRLQ